MDAGRRFRRGLPTHRTDSLSSQIRLYAIALFAEFPSRTLSLASGSVQLMIDASDTSRAIGYRWANDRFE